MLWDDKEVWEHESYGSGWRCIQVNLYKRHYKDVYAGTGLAVYNPEDAEVPYDREIGEALATARARLDLIREEIKGQQEEVRVIKNFIWEAKQKGVLSPDGELGAQTILASRINKIDQLRLAKRNIKKTIQDIIHGLTDN